MPKHQLNQVKAAIRPSLEDLRIASEVIVARLSERMDHTVNLIAAVEERFQAELITGLSGLEGVREGDMRSAKAIAATIVALAHLESTGHVLPFGAKTMLADRLRERLTISYSSGRSLGEYRVGDEFNYEVAEVYLLPRTGLATELDSPLVFLSTLPASMGPKVRRVLRESADAYRAGLFVAAAILLGTASEAAWEQLARVLVSAGDDSLSTLVSDPSGRAAEVQARALQALRRRKAAPPGVLAALDATARAYRDLRNHAVHEPEGSFDEQLFARAVVSSLLSGSVFYFRNLYATLDDLRSLPGPSS